MTPDRPNPPRQQSRGVPLRFGASLTLALLLHALLLVSLERTIELTGDPGAEGRTLTVELAPRRAAPPPAAAVPPPPPPVVQERAAPAPRKRAPRIARLEPDRSRPLVLDPPRDLSDMIRAARERRGEPEPAEPAPPPVAAAPQDNRIALENIRRSAQQARGRDGVNGLFQILSKGPRVARFSFRGWHTDSSRQWNQTIEVDAGPNGDVERAIVRKMIELIRQHHNGDFNWESRRLGRVVSLSARPQDSAGLEDFLLREFF